MEHRTSRRIGDTPYRAHGWHSARDGGRFATTSSGRCRFLFELFIGDTSRPLGREKCLVAGGPVQCSPVGKRATSGLRVTRFPNLGDTQ
jgi:hypothetical protein